MKKIILYSLFCIIIIYSAPVALAAYQIQVQLPGTELQVGATPGIAQYISGIYSFALLIAGITAFGVIVFAAIEYVVSAGYPSLRADALDRIWQAIFGLILLFAAYLILNTINPELVQIGGRQERLQEILPPIPQQQLQQRQLPPQQQQLRQQLQQRQLPPQQQQLRQQLQQRQQLLQWP